MADVDPREYAPDAAALDWFLRYRAGDHPVMETSRPIRRAIENLERWSRGEIPLAPTHDARESSAVRSSHLNDVTCCDLFLGRAAGWWVRILQGHEERRPGCFSVEPSFVSNILGERDAPGQDGPWIPGGVGTLHIAMRCLHLGGGSVHIGGVHSPGADVYWRPDSHSAILFERKDRAFYRAFDPHASLGSVQKWLLDEVREATTGLFVKAPSHVGDREVVRVASVGGVFPIMTAERLHKDGADLARKVVRRASKQAPRMPSALLIYVFGVAVKGASLEAASLPHLVEFVPRGFRPTPAFEALRRVFGADEVRARTK